MNAPSNSPSNSAKSGPRRGLFVSLVIGTAAAAVTAGVALNQRHTGEAVVQRADASPADNARATVAAVREHAPLAERASASLVDPLLPAASEVLERVPAGSGELAPTF